MAAAEGRRALATRRITVTALLIVLIAAAFWGGSRYPNLGEKAAMASGLVLADPLGFEPALPVREEDPAAQRIFATTVNWVATNFRGMLFGILLAAAFFTGIPLLQGLAFRGRLPNALLGMTIGAPLGVCVNCATPIAQGMHTAGARIETTLGTLFSAPTLNAVVLAILLSLFPLSMVVIKLAATLLFLVVGIPLLARFFAADALPGQALADPPAPPVADAAADESWRDALVWLARSYPRALGSLVRSTVPLMLLAGLLGAAAITLLPWPAISASLEQMEGAWGWLGLVGVALFGLFLPVPIAFDVFLCASLLSAGLRERDVMVLLFTLGIFSVYPFAILARNVSWRLAVAASVLLTVLGVSAGLAAEYGAAWDARRREASFLAAFQGLEGERRRHDPGPAGEDDGALVDALRRRSVRFEPFPIQTPAEIRIDVRRNAPSGPPRAGHFRREEGRDLGFHEAIDRWLVYRHVVPFAQLGGLAAGDVHGDGWVDLVLASGRGLYLYANLAGEGFALQEIDVPEVHSGHVGVVALADLDDDGWLDLLFSVYRRGHYVIYNRDGRFAPENLERLPSAAANLATAAALGDLDGDGKLELVLGNFTAGQTFLFPEESRNTLLRRRDGRFVAEALPGVPGETLSVLLSDIDGDDDLDLMVGNDYQIPDVYYLGDGEGGLRRVRRDDGLFLPEITYSTMSLDSADLDNDLDLEIYAGQISGGAFEDHERLVRPTADVCAEFDDPRRRTRCSETAKVDALVQYRGWRKSFDSLYQCRRLPSAELRHDCVAVELYNWSRSRGTAAHCRFLLPRWAEVMHLCGYLARHGDGFRKYRKIRSEQLQQQEIHNVLFQRDGAGRFVDRAEALGVDVAGWTWNAKFADLDHDEWQDLYVSNGFVRSVRRESNILFRNRGGRAFEDATEEAGLLDFLPTGGSVFVDLDNDGDLDIVTAPFHDTPWIYHNETGGSRALTVELRDFRGNRFGVGSQVRIHYGDGASRHQVREMKAGGGFASFDPPILHFGLGASQAVERLEVRWSTGERSEIRGPFPAGARYRITRQPAGLAAARRAGSGGGEAGRIAGGVGSGYLK